MTRFARVGQSVLVLHGLVFVLISISVWFAPDPLERDGQFLVTNFGVTAGYLIVCLAVFGLNAQQRWAWFTLWVLPVFYLWLVVANDTPAHLAFAAVAAGALAVTRPREQGHRSAASAVTSVA